MKATHKFFHGGGVVPTFYHVKQTKIFQIIDKFEVYYWCTLSEKWVLSRYHPPIGDMILLNPEANPIVLGKSLSSTLAELVEHCYEMEKELTEQEGIEMTGESEVLCKARKLLDMLKKEGL